LRRREFMTLVGGAALAWPHAARAQRQTIPVVGFLNSASADGYAAMAAAFREGLKEAGYVVGQNVAIEYRWAENQYDRLPAFAADLASRKVAVIFANSPSIAPARAATQTIPITFMSGDDPVRLGFVASLNRPGGNTTGVAILSGELAAKRFGVLLELVPKAKAIAILVNSAWPASARFQADVEAVARQVGQPLQVLQANNEREIEGAFASMSQARAEALLVGPGPFLDSRRDLLVSLAAKAAVPAAYETRATAVAGGLVSYGASVQEGYRQAGIYTGRVLKGEKPADMPIMLPTKLELVINLKTAKTLGLSVPANLIALADEVIE
jgi:putative tryptophan/tyrosine transport system substrate-binding protein